MKTLNDIFKENGLRTRFDPSPLEAPLALLDRIIETEVELGIDPPEETPEGATP